MTRKDYILIAAALRTEIDRHHTRMGDMVSSGLDEEADQVGQRLYAVKQVAYQLATALQSDNPRFNHDRFIEAATGVAN